jgi:hypothetical protein
MYHTRCETLKARARHRCTSCGEMVEVREIYKRWRTYHGGGEAGTSKMHPECLAMHEAEAKFSGDTVWEYERYSHERPAQP